MTIRADRRSRYMSLALVVAALVVGAPPKAAEIYKWVDETGEVHYGDEAPPRVESEKVRVNATRDEQSAARLERLEKRVNDDFAARSARKAALVEEQANEKKIAEYCRESQENLVKLQTSTRRQYVDDKGELAFIPEDMRQEWIKKVEAEIDEHCK